MNNELPKRKNIRLKNYDYSLPGTYFVTICTQARKNYFWNDQPDLKKIKWDVVGRTAFARRIFPFPALVKLLEKSWKKWIPHTRRFLCTHMLLCQIIYIF